MQLLGHDAVAHQRAGDEVGDDGGQHQRQDHVVVAGQLEHEHDRGERGPGRRAERRRHGDDGERAGRTSCPGNTALTPAPKRLPKPALISRIGASVPPDVPDAEREPPREQLGERERGDVAEREAVDEHVADGVVADTRARGGTNKPIVAKTDGADDRVPEVADRQPAVPAPRRGTGRG